MMIGDVSILFGLFLTSFAAATVFPAQSEALLAGLILKTDLAVWLLVAVASVGNILGSCVNWLLGRYLETLKERRWFPTSNVALERAKAFYRKYGRWSLLPSWVPIIGDPITVIAGILRERLAVFVPIVSIAKAGRYIVVTILTLQISNGTS